MEELELSSVVFGDRGEVLVEGRVEQIERVNRLLRPERQNEYVSETSGLLEALEVSVEGDDAGAERDRPGSPAPRPTAPVPGARHVCRNHVLGVSEVDRGP